LVPVVAFAGIALYGWLVPEPKTVANAN
jgi:hypothetical protein